LPLPANVCFSEYPAHWQTIIVHDENDYHGRV